MTTRTPLPTNKIALVAYDDQTQNTIMRDRLEENGYVVDVAVDESDALMHAQLFASTYDVAFISPTYINVRNVLSDKPITVWPTTQNTKNNLVAC